MSGAGLPTKRVIVSAVNNLLCALKHGHNLSNDRHKASSHCLTNFQSLYKPMPPNIGTLCFKNGFTICESRQFYCCYYPDDWSAVVLRFGVKNKASRCTE